MLTTWVFVAIFAGTPEGQIDQAGQANQAIVMPLSSASMTCKKEGDHLVCVIPIKKEATQEAKPLGPKPLEPKPAAVPTPNAKSLRPRPSLLALGLPGPEAQAQIRAAEANIVLAKSLLPKAKTPEQAMLAQQLLYWASEQRRAADALTHTIEGDLRQAPDPFDDDKHESDADEIALCQGTAEDCKKTAPHAGM